MTPKPKGIAARAGHWSARHRKTAIFGWLAAVVIVFMVGQSLGQKAPDRSESLNGESRRATQVFDDAGFPEKSGEMVLVQSKNATASDPAFKAAVADVTKTVSAQKIVTNVTKPQISKDKHSALVQFDLKGDPETADDARRAGAGRHRRGRQAPSGAGHRAVRRRVDDQGPRREVGRGGRQLDDADLRLDPGDPASSCSAPSSPPRFR